MTLSEHAVMWLFSLIAAGGAFQALTLWRLWAIEQKIGNGSPGIFARQVVVDAAQERTDERLHDLETR